MPFRSVMLELVADCPRCGAVVPLPGAVAEASCPRCEADIPLSPKLWRRVLAEPLAEALLLPEGKGRTARIRSNPSVRMLYGPGRVRCEACRLPLPLDVLVLEARNGAEGLFCPDCGYPVVARVRPKWLASVHPAAALLIGEAPEPTASAHRWYVLLDLGDAVGAAPLTARRLADYDIGPDGQVLLAWHGQQDGEPRLGMVDRRGLLAWLDEGLGFSEQTLVRAAGHRLTLIDLERGTIERFDTASGQSLGRPTSAAPAEGSRLDVRDARCVVLDLDGSLLVARDWGHGDTRLRRFGSGGVRIPLWEGSGKEEEDAVGSSGALASFASPCHRFVRLPQDAVLRTGWDGYLYLLRPDTGAIARYSRRGHCVAIVRPRPDAEVARVHDLGVDAAGRVLLLYEHARPVGGSRWDHLGWLRSGGRLEPWLGPHVRDASLVLPPEVRRMKVGPDGAVLFGDAVDQLRLINPDGEVLWESPALPRLERRWLERLARGGSRLAPRAG